MLGSNPIDFHYLQRSHTMMQTTYHVHGHHINLRAGLSREIERWKKRDKRFKELRSPLTIEF